MNTDEYLARLRAQLKGLPSEKQAELIEEIAAHLAEGQSDPRLGEEPAGREQRLEAEMGAPEDLGRRMQNLHHHNRWIDYFLVVAPALLFSPVIALILLWIFPASRTGQGLDGILTYWEIRILLLTQIVLISLGIQRYRRYGTPGLAVYWLAETWWIVVALCLRENRLRFNSAANLTTGGLIETILWLAVLLGLGIGIFRMVARARDPLMVVLALLPFTIAAGNLVTGQVRIAGGFPGGYHLPNWRLGFFGLTQVGLVVWPALFFLFRQRPVRWLGLLANAAPLALLNLIAATQYPALMALWSLPVALVLTGWAVDWSQRQNQKAVAG